MAAPLTETPAHVFRSFAEQLRTGEMTTARYFSLWRGMTRDLAGLGTELDGSLTTTVAELEASGIGPDAIADILDQIAADLELPE